jgi:hypothetical protein
MLPTTCRSRQKKDRIGKTSVPGTMCCIVDVTFREEKIVAYIPLKGKAPFSAFPTWPLNRRGYMLRNDG